MPCFVWRVGWASLELFACWWAMGLRVNSSSLSGIEIDKCNTPFLGFHQAFVFWCPVVGIDDNDHDLLVTSHAWFYDDRHCSVIIH